MKQLIFVLLISCLACANNQAGQAERKKDMESTKEIYLAGGCFWGTEHFLKLIDGVETTQVGYANGHNCIRLINKYVPELRTLQKP